MNNSVKSYNTKQRNLILEFLIENKDRHFTAEEILEILKKNNTPVGKATLYRYLDMLVSVGEVHKYIDDDRFSVYQYIEGGNQNLNHYFHLKCYDCGKLFHVDCDMIKRLNKHIEKEHDFCVDPSKVVFYGLCSECRENRKVQE